MAKVHSLIEVSGTLFGMTFVRSKRYGNHVRAPRGSKSPVRLNDAFLASTELMKKANVYARILKDAIKSHHGGQRDGTLWIRLIKFFREQLKTTE